MLFFFFFNDTATTEIYTLSLHDALPIYVQLSGGCRAGLSGPEPGGRVSSPYRAGDEFEQPVPVGPGESGGRARGHGSDRKSTRLNSSHANISYAVFCLKKKKKSAYDYFR